MPLSLASSSRTAPLLLRKLAEALGDAHQGVQVSREVKRSVVSICAERVKNVCKGFSNLG